MAPRSWPSRPGFATRMRRGGPSVQACMDGKPLPVFLRQQTPRDPCIRRRPVSCGTHFANGGIGFDGIEHGRHNIFLPTSHVCQALQSARYLSGITFCLHPLQTCHLACKRAWVGTVQRNRGGPWVRWNLFTPTITFSPAAIRCSSCNAERRRRCTSPDSMARLTPTCMISSMIARICRSAASVRAST